MWMLVKVMPLPTTSLATTLDHESRADFDATYAEKRGGLVCTPIELTLTTCPDCWRCMTGISPITSRTAPK